MSDRRPIRVAVVGGGISGIAAANRILELDSTAEIVLLEAGPRLGGVLRTERKDGFLIEYGADNFITTMPWGIDFCRRIGFEQALVPTAAAHRRAFVVHNGKLQPIPSGFAIMAPSRIWPVVSTPILSPLGKLRLAAELVIPRRKRDDDESMASFVKRRLGRQTYERLVQPLVGGIYTADPEQLSVDATMPRFREMERKHGSLIRAIWTRSSNPKPNDKKASGARYSQFVAPREGMSSLVDAAADRLPKDAIHVESPVVSVTPLPGGRWQVATGGQSPQQRTVDAIVLTLRSHQCAHLLQGVDDDLANDLSKIGYGSCALATFGYQRNQVRHPLDGFGVVVPLVEGRRILSASFSSVKYPGRAPDGHVLIRTYIGGALQSELLDLDDEQLLTIAQQELNELLGVDGQPRLSHISRQINAMPQYHVGHQSLVQKITAQADKLTSFALASNSLHGVGIPHCIHTAEVAVDQLFAKFASQGHTLSSQG